MLARSKVSSHVYPFLLRKFSPIDFPLCYGYTYPMNTNPSTGSLSVITPRLREYPKSTVSTFINTQNQKEEILELLNGRELNKTTLADIAGIGYSIVHRADLALYDSIPPALNVFFRSVDPGHHWNVHYLNYKRGLLVEHKEIVSPRLWLKISTKKFETWTEFRELVADTQMEFAKLFLINPAILQHFESGKTKFLPVVIKNRLEYFGMSGENIAFLADLPVGERTIVE